MRILTRRAESAAEDGSELLEALEDLRSRSKVV
jgi:hypothetical protein